MITAKKPEGLSRLCNHCGSRLGFDLSDIRYGQSPSDPERRFTYVRCPECGGVCPVHYGWPFDGSPYEVDVLEPPTAQLDRGVLPDFDSHRGLEIPWIMPL